MSVSESHKIGEQVGDFLRGLLQVKSTDTAQKVLPEKKKYIVVDSTETSTGTTVSLDMESDGSEILGSFTRDVTFDGIVQFRAGATFPLQQIIAKDYANALSLQPVPNKPNSWNIVADGDVQPFGMRPYEVMFLERIIPSTSVVRISGQILDPNPTQTPGDNETRVNFTVTHDPVETVVLAIVAGLAALICGGVVLVAAATDHCTAQGQMQCGGRGVRKITLRRKYGFSWKKGSVDIGCGEECMIECNP
jgi:hypothetical protein